MYTGHADLYFVWVIHSFRNLLSVYIIHQDGIKTVILYDKLCMCRPTVNLYPYRNIAVIRRWAGKGTFCKCLETHSISSDAHIIHTRLHPAPFSRGFFMPNKLGASIPIQGEDWLSEIYARLLYGKLECNEYSARSTTGAIQIEITCDPYQPCTFSTLDASPSDAISTMDTSIIINLIEDHHMSKSLMPSP